jgi:GH18 family chitinase
VSPKPNPDGSCASYSIVKDDNCFDIAAKYSLTVDRIYELNKNTWGWAGCSAVQPGQKICLSTGSPPMPAAIRDAQCGPQKEGTQPPPSGVALKDLNPCPLSVCCNIWGQCGTTEDFCIESPADTGAPGTSQPLKNGCISNCGMDIINNAVPPASFARVAYFEAWNQNRRCLNMDVTQIDKTKFTHIHFAFGDITPDYRIDVSKVQAQFDLMKSMTGIKRIISFGGWAFSTEAPTYNIFRQGVTAENRALFATNVYNFVMEHGLDGVDFDWEYPAAPDLPEIPPGIIQEGLDYLEFLRAVKRRLRTKLVSIAAPASYWYLKGYPMKDIGAVVDYVIYMTYDLHGQWDYGNKWASPGCELGNCLRSHVNLTETTNALAMITRAGIQANKVFVGVASYGRSFKMAEQGCVGVMCRFLGDGPEGKISLAAKGLCTDTAGYLANAEIREIINFAAVPGSGYTASTYHNHGSNSDVLVYNDLEWVSYMTDITKETRTNWYKSLNFGGVSDWAVDLDRDWGGSGIGSGDDELGEGLYCDPDVKFADLAALEAAAAAGTVTPGCHVVYTLDVLGQMLKDAVARYNDVNNGYDGKFNSYTRYMKNALPYQLQRWAHWRGPLAGDDLLGKGQQYFDCNFDGDGDTRWQGPCHVPQDVVGNHYMGIWSLQMTLRDSAGFDKALGDLGIDREWIYFGEHIEEIKCAPGTGGTGVCVDFELTIQGYPKFKAEWEVPNPKDIMTEAMKNLQKLYTELAVAMFEIGYGTWEGSNSDVVEVLSMPIFMMTQAVDGMAQAKEIGEDWEAEENKDLILTIITAVLFFVPALGQFGAAAAGLARLARVFAAVGGISGLGMTIVDIVENPEMAPLAIAGMLLGGKIKTPKEYGVAAGLRRGLADTVKNGMGDIFKKNDQSLTNIIRACRR